jgi:hypothetical protein
MGSLLNPSAAVIASGTRWQIICYWLEALLRGNPTLSSGMCAQARAVTKQKWEIWFRPASWVSPKPGRLRCGIEERALSPARWYARFLR